jgi:hypothetical protein
MSCESFLSTPRCQERSAPGSHRSRAPFVSDRLSQLTATLFHLRPETAQDLDC